MADTLKTYFDFAQFSMAAYATLPIGTPQTAALQGAGLTSVLADEFATNYRVVSVPSGQQQQFGFSAQLFEKRKGDRLLFWRSAGSPARA